MKMFFRAVRMVLAVMSVVVCLLLCLQAVEIYRTGVYTREIVKEHLAEIAPVLCFYAVLAVCGLVLAAAVTDDGKVRKAALAGRGKARTERIESMAGGAKTRGTASAGCEGSKTAGHAGSKTAEEAEEAPASAGRKRLPRLRLILYAAAVLMIALGAANGGARDVLVKAVNICTECIGLG